jgi:hypothetical protein
MMSALGGLTAFTLCVPDHLRSANSDYLRTIHTLEEKMAPRFGVSQK